MSDVKFGEILEPEDEEAHENRVRGGFWTTFRRAARRIPFSEDLVAAYYCALDPATPHRVRAVLLAALAYFVLPFDAVPDLLAVVGFSDDIAVLAAAMVLSLRIPARPGEAGSAYPFGAKKREATPQESR